MSTQALAGATTMPPGELAAAQRVQQIQTLLAQAGQASAPVASASTGGFAEALRTASMAGPAGAQYPGASAATGSSQYDPLVNQAAARYGLDPAILHGLIQQESGFDPSSTSSAGAVGLTQLMPSTAASLGVADPLDPAQSIEGGARYLSQMMSQFGGDTSKALAAYNAGPGAVQQYGGIPPYSETQSYVAKVLAYADAYRQSPVLAPTEGIA